jgi:Magnesium transporter NIPA
LSPSGFVSLDPLFLSPESNGCATTSLTDILPCYKLNLDVGMSNDNATGLGLAVSSSLFIGSSFVIKKVGHRKAALSGKRAAESREAAAAERGMDGSNQNDIWIGLQVYYNLGELRPAVDALVFKYKVTGIKSINTALDMTTNSRIRN